MSNPPNPPRSRAAFVSVVPSPYQRDVFDALAQRRRLSFRVHYLEHAAPDSPWPVEPLREWESVLPGATLGRARWRSHVNWRMPAPASADVWIVNAAMTDFTTQRFIRRLGSRTPWCFWGELPSAATSGWRRWVQARQYAPLRRARAIVAVGERARAAYLRLVPGVPAFNQPYACRLDAFAAAAAQCRENAEPVFLFCGQMIARKGIDILLRAFASLIAEKIPARLELVGREAQLPEFIGSIAPAARERISYLGFKPPSELPAIFARADVFVLPSRHDGWGVVVNQALGARLPVICSDAVGAAHDLLQHEKNGLVVPAGDASALARAMRRLAASLELRRAYATAAGDGASELEPERAAEFWESLVQKIASSA
jgi:glycosyltransferase involved in cell wall biosynthesis